MSGGDELWPLPCLELESGDDVDSEPAEEGNNAGWLCGDEADACDDEAAAVWSKAVDSIDVGSACDELTPRSSTAALNRRVSGWCGAN